MPGAGPVKVITDRGVLVASEFDGEMELAALYPGMTVEDVTSRVGWPLRVRDDLETVSPPSREELRLLREVLDPSKLYLKGG
jgi:glutaconate CoA-transferase subunit B